MNMVHACQVRVGNRLGKMHDKPEQPMNVGGGKKIRAEPDLGPDCRSLAEGGLELRRACFNFV